VRLKRYGRSHSRNGRLSCQQVGPLAGSVTSILAEAGCGGVERSLQPRARGHARRHHLDLSGCEVYACGSVQMVEAAVPAFLAQGLGEAFCFSDAFVPASGS
jgi:hypothetical protein